jgi:hypothetical protein
MVAVSIGGLVAALVGGHTVKLPGAIVSTLLYGSLSLLMLRGHTWARWALFAFAVLMAGACLFFDLSQFDRLGANYKAGTAPVLAALVLAYASAGVGLAWSYGTTEDTGRTRPSPAGAEAP